MADSSSSPRSSPRTAPTRSSASTLRTLGLGKIGSTTERPRTPTRSAASIHKVQHLVKVED